MAFYYKVLHEATHKKVPYAFDPWAPQEALCVLQEPGVRSTPAPERETSSFSTVFPEPCITKPYVVPSGRGQIFTGLSSIITEQTMKCEYGAGSR